MKRIIFIFAFMAMITGAFFFYNNSIMADDKDSKCTSCECTKSASCSKKCTMESKSMNGQTGGEMNECRCKAGKCDVKKQSGSCPYMSGGEYKHEGTKKSGSCPYMKKEKEAKI